MREFNFKNKIQYLHGEMSSLALQERDNVATPFYSIFSIICRVVAYGKLKTKDHIFKLLALKVIAVAYES